MTNTDSVDTLEIRAASGGPIPPDPVNEDELDGCCDEGEVEASEEELPGVEGGVAS